MYTYTYKKNVINLDEYADVGTHWIASYVLNNNITNFDGFRANSFQMKFKKNHQWIFDHNKLF